MARDLRLTNCRRALEEKSRENEDLTRAFYALVAQQVDELQRVGRLRRFLSPQLAELALVAGGEALLESHRQDVTVVFCDLRGFTALAEAATAEELMRVLSEFHEVLGRTVFDFGGTIERFAGDAIMVFFNDPLPCPDAAARALRMSLAMQKRVRPLINAWRARGHELELGIGIAAGLATLGQVGFAGRVDYAAIGRVTNLASRLCAAAAGAQILVDETVAFRSQGRFLSRTVGPLWLKGLHAAVQAFEIRDELPTGTA